MLPEILDILMMTETKLDDCSHLNILDARLNFYKSRFLFNWVITSRSVCR